MNYRGQYDFLDFMLRNLITLALFAVIFALNEKQRKEFFIISHTNSKTKK
jgi:hypothetical protein